MAKKTTKWAVTAVSVDPETRRTTGRCRTEVVDTKTWGFGVLTDAKKVEGMYEAFWNDVVSKPESIVKVIDTRPADDAEQFVLPEVTK